jgi:hypothetical protein
MSFANARIYDLNGDFEAIYSDTGWSTSNSKKNFVSKDIRKIMTAPGQSRDYEINRKKTITKARGSIRRRIKKFRLLRKWELTFSDNIQEVKKADEQFRNFMKRISRRYPGFKYVATREFQDKNDRGAVHYHIAVNMYIPKKKLNEIWGQGFTWMRAYFKDGKAGRKNIYNYLTKYLTKYSNDERLKGFHLYLCSHGLNVLFTDMIFYSAKEFLSYLFQNYKNVAEKFINYYENVGLTIVI